MSLHRVTDTARIAPLFEGWADGLIRSTLDGCMGEAYADDACTAARITNGDFALLAGDAASRDAPALAKHVPEDYPGGTLLIVPGNESWRAVVEKAWAGKAVPAERYAIRTDTNRFNPDTLRALRETLPAGVRLAPIDGALYRRALEAEWSRDFVSLFRNEEDYLARGLGVMALAGEEPVAGASSYAVYRGGIEIEIDTREDWRRRGLAAACGAALMLECFARGLYPGWDAASRASVALAEKLGYVFDRPYPVYEIRLP